MVSYINRYQSPLGGMTLASDGKALTGLWFDEQKYFGMGLSEERVERELPVFEETRRWLDSYFHGNIPDFAPALSLSGTEFRQEVWNILREIPYGQTTTYGKIAKRIAEKKGLKSMSAQAVGGAVGHNPISIIIPCHRVLGSDGSLTGYAGGVDKKQKLLVMEKNKVGQPLEESEGYTGGCLETVIK